MNPLNVEMIVNNQNIKFEFVNDSGATLISETLYQEGSQVIN